MKKNYVCPIVKVVCLSNEAVMAASIDAIADGTTDNVGSKNSFLDWDEE